MFKYLKGFAKPIVNPLRERRMSPALWLVMEWPTKTHQKDTGDCPEKDRGEYSSDRLLQGKITQAGLRGVSTRLTLAAQAETVAPG